MNLNKISNFFTSPIDNDLESVPVQSIVKSIVYADSKITNTSQLIGKYMLNGHEKFIEYLKKILMQIETNKSIKYYEFKIDKNLYKEIEVLAFVLGMKSYLMTGNNPPQDFLKRYNELIID